MTIRDGLVGLAGLLVAVAAVGLVAGPGVRSRLAVLCTLPLLVVPFVAPVPPPFRWLLAFVSAWAVIRAVDLSHHGFELPPWHRALHMVTPFDTRAVRRVPRSLPPIGLLRFVGFAALAAAACWVALDPPGQALTVRTGMRWAAGAVAAYSGFDALVALGLTAAGLVGAAVPVVHDNPILSRSVREFWGARWNILVHTWLRTHVFEPTRARAGTGAALAATFAVSGLHHAYLFWPAVGATLSASVALFFAGQAGLLAVESRLRVRDWSAASGRAFTLAALGLTSPLVIEPALRVIETAFGLRW